MLVGDMAELGLAARMTGNLGDDVERAALRLDIDPAQIFADHAEHEHLHRAEDDDDQHQ
jgi:hypothetical protein